MLKRRSPGLIALLAITIAVLATTVTGAAQTLRKIGEMRLAVLGVTAAVDPIRPAIPKNVAAGVRIVLRGGGAVLAPAAVAQMFGALTVEGELSGPSLEAPVPLVATYTGSQDLVLPLPALALSGEHTLSNLRLSAGGQPILDLTPSTVSIDVIDQVLVTSVQTRALTLDQIKDRGIVLDSDDYLGFEFTLGLRLESRVVNVSFPVVFDRYNVPVPTPLSTPQLSAAGVNVPAEMIPTFVPMMLELPVGFNALKFDNTPADVKIPSLLVIPGDVGYLRQFFSAQLLVANGTPAGSQLTVSDISGELLLPPGADQVLGTSDDPLSRAETVRGIQPLTMAVTGVGADGLPGTADDTTVLRAGEQGQAEFLIRGDLEGFHTLSFDIDATLHGLATGPVPVRGRATGGVLVRNPFFDVSFVVPSIVREGEPFKLYATISNKGAAAANNVSVALDAARMSGAHLTGPASVVVNTLAGGDAKTVAFEFVSDRTGEVVASYLNFTGPGTTGNIAFTVGVGERGLRLSPDTIALPTQVSQLPAPVVNAAVRVVGQAWSIANAPAGTLPAGVIRTSKTVVLEKALALAEAGLRVSLGQPQVTAVRDLLPDFFGGAPVDRGFDQLLRNSHAGRDFVNAVGAALAPSVSSAATFERAFTTVAASGRDVVAFSVDGVAGTVVTLTDAQGRRSQISEQSADPWPQLEGAALAPLGSGAVFGVVASPDRAPYILELSGATGAADVSVAYPAGNGQMTRGVALGVPTTVAGVTRLTIDPSRSTLAWSHLDSNGVELGTGALTIESIAPSAPQLLSATVVGPETLPSAGPFGFHVAMLFDRAVDPQTASDESRYAIPRNGFAGVKGQLSGRLVFGALRQPEGPYVASQVTVTGMRDLRGTAAAAQTVPLNSQLAGVGAVVSGTVYHGDGTPAAGLEVVYQGNPDWKYCQLANVVGFAAATTDAAGRYEFRFVRQNNCGGFTLAVHDPVTGAVRTSHGVVRTAGERLVMDMALMGRGHVTGVVRNLAGQPVAAARVLVVSTIDPGSFAQVTTDGTGRYNAFGIVVGQVSVKAVNGVVVGSAAGQIARAGTTATVDVTLNSGSVNLSGTVRKLENGQTSPAPDVYVVYSVPDSGRLRPVGVARTALNGTYTMVEMPAGAYTIEVTLGTGDRTSLAGTSAPGDVLTGRDLTVLVNRNATVNGSVQLPDGAPMPFAVVTMAGRGTTAAADGTFSLANAPVSPTPQLIAAYSPDGARQGNATVLLNQTGQVLNGVVVTLAGQGTLDLLLLDAFGQPVPNTQVVVTRAGSRMFTNACLGIAGGTTDALGHVVIPNLEVGTVAVKSVWLANGYYDVATLSTAIPAHGVTTSAVMRFDGAGTVTGLVRDAAGAPVTGADVQISANRFDPSSCSLVGGGTHAVRTGADGRFTAPNVLAGQVGVRVSQSFFPAPVTASGVIVGNGDTLDFDLRLINTLAGELSGTVYLPDGVTPAGAGVQVKASGALPDVIVTTDASGVYRFAPIFPQGFYVISSADPVTGGVAQERIYLRAGEDAVHDQRLKGRGTVRVRVVDGAGAAVSQALVRLTEASYPNASFDAVLEAANEGVVAFSNVHEGTFNITASDPLGRGGRVSGQLPGPGIEIDVVVRLTVTGTVEGRFLMPGTNTPVPFVGIRLLSNNRVIGQATTLSGVDVGRFQFLHVPAGNIRLEGLDPATGRGGVAVGTLSTQGQVLTLDVLATALGTVQGTVTSNGLPVPAAHVEVVSGSFRANLTADHAGQFTVPAVPEGAVTVSADLHGALKGVATRSFSGEGATATIDVALRASGTVTGVVTEAVGGGPAPPSIVTVQVGGVGGGTQSTTTDEAGAFQLDRVPAGNATITVDVMGSIDTARVETLVVGADTVDVPIALMGIGGISGMALETAGVPTAGALEINGTGQVPYRLSLTVGATGTFSAPQVLAGPFTARFTRQVGGVTLSGSASGVVLPGDTLPIQLMLQPSGTITGRVVRSNGTTPAVGASVTVRAQANFSATTMVQALADGIFTATGVPLGTYTVNVHDVTSNGYAQHTGAVLATSQETVDVGTVVLDDTGLAVVSYAPADQSVNVPLNTPIVVQFTDPLPSGNGFIFTRGTEQWVAGGILSPDRKTVTFNGPWWDSSNLTVLVRDISDIHGRRLSEPVSFQFSTVDITPPSVSSVSPGVWAAQVPASTAIAVTFSEPLAATTNLATLLTVTTPGGPVAGVTTQTSPSVVTFVPSAPLPAETRVTVTVNGARDAAGNQQVLAYTWNFATTDTVAPVVVGVSPTPGAWTRDSTPTILASHTDAASGTSNQGRTLTVDGVGYTAYPIDSGTMNEYMPSFPDGDHTVTVTVADRAGNVGSATWTFRLDSVPPTVPVVSGLTEGQTVVGPFFVSAVSSDGGSGVAAIRVYSENNSYLGQLTGPGFSGSFPTTSWTEGPHSITAEAVDVAGGLSVRSAPINFVVNNIPITTAITAPAVNYRTRQPVTVTATVSEPATQVAFTIGSNTVVDTTAPFSATVPLTGVPDGVTAITVVATSTMGDTATATRNIVVDRLSPVAHWTLDEGTGTTTADVSANGHTGTLQNAVAWTNTGRFGRGLTFDGVDDAVSVADSALLDATTALSLSAWVSPTAVNTVRPLVSKGSGAGLAYRLAVAADNVLEMTLTLNGVATTVRGTSSVTLGGWTHAVGTYDGAALRLYVNGVQQAIVTATGPILDSASPVLLGRDEGGSTLSGRLDDVRVYDRALTAAEIAAMASAQAAGRRLATWSGMSIVAQPQGAVWTIGQQNSGSLGIGNGTPLVNRPNVVTGLSDVVAVSTGSMFNLALTASGTAYAWGYNGNGVLGDGTQVARSVPTAIALSNVVAIDAGLGHSVALLANGDAYTWGDNAYGQLGDGTTIDSYVPKLVMSGVRAISAGADYSLFVKASGTVWGVGKNSFGSLGDGTTVAQRLTPVQAVGVTTAVDVSAGESHSIVLMADGTVRTMGYFGHLGTGGSTNQSSPVAVPGLTDIVSVSAARIHSAALKSDGTVWTWGYNSSGQIGNGTLTAQLTPAQVPGLTGVVDLNAGYLQNLAVTQSGVLYAWGENMAGVLGDGTANTRTSPTPATADGYTWKAGTPSFSLAPATYTTDRTTTVTTVTPGATIRYTTNGVEPTEADPIVASGGTLAIDRTMTLKAKTFSAGVPASNTQTADYTMTVQAVTFSVPTNGTHTSAQTVTLSTTTSGATIYYTLNGATPDQTSTPYTGPFVVNTTTTIRATAYRTGWTPSTVSLATLTMNFGTLSTPVITPATGTYEGSASVSISMSAPSGAIIRYTTDGGTPNTSSPVYSGPFTRTTTGTVKAAVFHSDYATSATATSVLTIAAATPTFSLGAGTYAPGTTFTVSGGNAADVIRVTTDGTTPTSTSQTVSSGTTFVVGNYTLKARAFRTGTTDSAVRDVTYALTGPLGPGAVSVGATHSLLATPDGRVYAWGSNAQGQLGMSTTITPRTVPTLIQHLTGVVAVSAGSNHSLALTADGRVFAWGFNPYGDAGDGGTGTRYIAQQVPGMTNAIAVAAGGSFSMALTSAGQVYAWGYGASGRLGLGTTTNMLVPTLVSALSNVVAIDASDDMAAALTSGGQMYVWGSGANSQLGLGASSANVLTPTAVPGVTDVISFTLGGSSAAALTAAGRTYVWGLNNRGQLGLGDTTARSVPTLSALTLTTLADRSTATWSALGVSKSGVLGGWGGNGAGQLGRGTMTTSELTSAAVISPFSGGTAHVAVGDHAVVVTSAGGIWSWGTGTSGQLGDNTSATRSTPALIGTITAAWPASAPAISVAPGTYATPQTVVITATTAGSTLRYTLDGSTPTESSPQVPANGQVIVGSSATLKTRAFVTGRFPSAVTIGTYVIQP